MLQVATYLMCGWIFNDHFIAECAKNILNIGKDMDIGQVYCSCFFQLASIITASKLGGMSDIT